MADRGGVHEARARAAIQRKIAHRAVTPATSRHVEFQSPGRG
jgi:hypothetical protein